MFLLKMCALPQKGVDVDEVKNNSFLKLYPSPELKVVHGGLRWHSGIVAPGLGVPQPLCMQPWMLQKC